MSGQTMPNAEEKNTVTITSTKIEGDSTTTAETTSNEKQTQQQFKEFQITVRNQEELISEIKDMSGDKYLWLLTYRVHSKDFMELKPPKKDESIRFRFNEVCQMDSAESRLENITKGLMNLVSDSPDYNTGWSINKTNGSYNLKMKCKSCEDDVDFCPHKMAAYIQFVCEKLQLDAENIYSEILGELYEKKTDLIKSYSITSIPQEEYNFIDGLSAAAAAELINTGMVAVRSNEDNRLVYTFVPICEKIKKSFVTTTLDFYKTGHGKYDFLQIADLQEEIRNNRNCADCIFQQCPDKVAAYIIALAEKYGVKSTELARFIFDKNRMGMTASGYYNFHEKMKELNDIPLTADSYKTIKNIAQYVINKWYVKDIEVPYIPFNMAVYTRDESLADKTVVILKDFLYYYNYWSDNPILKEYRFSQIGIDGLIDIVTDINSPTILHIKEMELLSALASASVASGKEVQLKMVKLTNLIKEKNDKVLLFISGEKNKLDNALSEHKDFYLGLISNRITISDMSENQIVDVIYAELSDKFELEEGFKRELENYVLDTYTESELKSRGYIDLVKQTVIFNHFDKHINIDSKLLVKDIPAVGNQRTRDEIWAELNGLTGLENVKNKIRDIENLLKFQKKISGHGVKFANKQNVHMVFAGNPGTGKTTVARLVAEILYNIGYIRQNKLVEVSPKDLIGQYIGHTAPKTAAVCESAYDGVLFIDEAYELTVGSGAGNNNFRSECITELIKQMEDNRDRLVVIFAGYTKEMENFLESNAGFASRIGDIIEFEDYTTEQLTAMFKHLVYKNGLNITEKALDRVSMLIERARMQSNFGNGRYARNLYEKVIMEHAKNTFDCEDVSELTLLTEADIPAFE